jgi:hypothetical protein
MAGLANTGSITMVGAGPNQTATFTVNGPASNAGTVAIGQFSTLSVGGGNAYTQTAGSPRSMAAH